MSRVTKEKLIFFLEALIAFSIATILGGFFFMWLIHENSHGLACLIFGLPFEWSLFKVNYLLSSNPVINTIVRLAGGLGQALFTIPFLWVATKLEEVFWKSVFLDVFVDEKRRSTVRNLRYGLEISLLTIAFSGILTAIWEGFSNKSYTENIGNYILWGPIFLVCGILALYITYRRH